ncbi:hypothetical protein IV38_GL000087 [Lactobacillus selangorensis]|uniref:Uncharacterized protein n=1 Tax=Lactobacillus selangorensis TaxID=81857 RepID=A0A0R2FUP9_9LACO|nr:hypothetical protein IV38_GL000087 [Lactobacillus selangorensis]KRN31435.1 hypothetical protein IV40_GL001431 [Lactobacillus selangorensis]
MGHNVKLDENVTVAAHLDGELKDMDAETQQEIHEYIEFKKAQYAKKHSQKD